MRCDGAGQRAIGSRAAPFEALTGWAFDVLGADGLERPELLRRVDNPASCRVAHKRRYDLNAALTAAQGE